MLIGNRRGAIGAILVVCVAGVLVALLGLPRDAGEVHAATAVAAAGATALPAPREVVPSGDLPPVGATLYVAGDGPHLVVVLGPTTELAPEGQWERGWSESVVPSWEARLTETGGLVDATPGPHLVAMMGWDGRGLALVQQGGERLVLQEYWGSFVYLRAALERDGHSLVHRLLGITGYNTRDPVSAPQYPRDATSIRITKPSAIVVDNRVWLATEGLGERITVSTTRWGELEWDDWDPCLRLGEGHAPSIAGTADAGLFVSYVERIPMHVREGEWTPSRAVDISGPIHLSYSEDGKEWSEPTAVTDEDWARSTALVLDPDAGLVLLYVAQREDGWPLMAARSADLGETWGKPVMLTTPDVHTAQPRAVLYEGRLYISYVETTGPSTTVRDPRWDGDPLGVHTLAFDPAELPAG